MNKLSKEPLYQVPVTSTEFEGDATLCGDVLRFKYYRDDVLHRSGISFKGVAATRIRAERSCKVWHIGAYDRLFEVEDSSWVDEIRADTDEHWRYRWAMHHYMIYLDSAGCFELIAESWEALPEEPGSW